MTPAHRRYFAVEMVVSAVINAILSVAFVFIVFGGQDQVAVWGSRGMVVDAAPQSFMVALMSCLVPTLLTRRRIAAGMVSPMTPLSPLPRMALLRAALVALIAAIVAVVAHAILLSRFGSSWNFPHVLAFKAVYGAFLGAAIAAVSVRLALGETRV